MSRVTGNEESDSVPNIDNNDDYLSINSGIVAAIITAMIMLQSAFYFLSENGDIMKWTILLTLSGMIMTPINLRIFGTNLREALSFDAANSPFIYI